MPAQVSARMPRPAEARAAQLIGRRGDPMTPRAAFFLVRGGFRASGPRDGIKRHGGSDDPPYVG